MIKRKIVFSFLLIIVIIYGCETQGDKFTRFSVKETILGRIKNHEIKKAFFLDEKTGFAAISRDTILKTTDSCKTFTLSLADISASFERIQFVNDTLGFIIDRNNKVFKTIDGGRSWTKSYISVPEASLLDIVCLNQDTIIIAAGGNPRSARGYLIRSVNGGETWVTVSSINLKNIFFINDSTGFASGYGGIIKTKDYGKTWDSFSSFPSEDICFFDNDNGYLSFNRSLFRTIDGGKNWKLVKSIINTHWIVGEDFSKIEGLNRLNDKDLVFTLNARLIKVTPDQKWYQYEFTRPYYQLQMIGKDKGIVYGFENLILIHF